MEIRKLPNPWNDDLHALIEALPLCWSEEEEARIMPVDLVRNNDFENPEIAVTQRRGIFVDVTHWRYTRQYDRLWAAFHPDAAGLRARSNAMPPELGAPYGEEALKKWRDENPDIVKVWSGGSVTGRTHSVPVVNNVRKKIVDPLDNLDPSSVKKTNEALFRQAVDRAFGRPAKEVDCGED